MLARVLWFLPLMSRQGSHLRDPTSQQLLYRREACDSPPLPPLVPVEAITARAHFVHACGHESHTPRCCTVVGGVLDHNLAVNNVFIKWERPASKA